MGYCMQQIDGSFLIRKENQAAAFRAIVDMFSDGEDRGWTKFNEVGSWRNLEDALDGFRFDTELNADQDLVGIHFAGENIGSERELFQVLAPWVEPGSFLEMCGEDGHVWRWVFDGRQVAEVVKSWG